jgi:EAL and modified HD-GYP domain-containing signal transduction protein
LGFDFFQGYFFAKPNTVRKQRLQQNQAHVLQLLVRLTDPTIELDEVYRLVSQDVGLSYKLLRVMNSAFFAPPQKVDSIRRALVYFGLDQLKRWAMLIALSGVEGKPQELCRLTLSRARFCEELAGAVGIKDTGMYFTAGLLSTLDALLDMPMTTLVGSLPLTKELAAGLASHDGPIGQAIDCAIAYERCQWWEASFCDLHGGAISDAYLEALDWSTQASMGVLAA